MKSKLQNLKDEILEKINEIKSEADVKEIELRYFSRKGEISEIMHSLKDLSLELRKEFGVLANKTKKELEEVFSKVKNNFSNDENCENLDITLPGVAMKRGHLHPITIIQREVEDLFTGLGFSIISGPELESDYFNFTALNMPPLHPARDMQDTFYVTNGKDDNEELDMVMRTHTSPVQIRAMQKYGAPLKAIIPGRCFRNEATDARHEHTFYQFEGLMVGENINFSNLKNLLEIVGIKLFGPETKLRMRPKFFPFVEPGNNGEYTCFLCNGKGCKVCKQTGWLEIVGAGLIHPNVLRAGGIDPEKYSGLAFGFGLTRLAMLKYGVNDTRLFNSGDLKFLQQF
ncbi:MAG: phenylalanine--tRNA ligase subunit alpha [Patescibacteria group bacterium]|nr:phenylalanine--tRNA ligase subunit alpha [Patescibacteria group bacterium]MDD3939453.1 phenylalanine--tRNA ligase subunit alpha [Patescibacteria group bacterium]NCU39490.1 phenylalanine--tRNA ligase subunit alpha [Candidatus Falkowbacteria bacterium]